MHYPDLFPDDETPIACELRFLELDMRCELEPSTLHALTSTSLASLTTLHLSNLTQLGATQLTSFFTTSPLPNLHTLILDTLYPSPLWSLLALTFPALTTLRVSARQTTLVKVLTALGTSAPPTVRNLSLHLQHQRGTSLTAPTICELLRIIQLPKMAGVRRVELPTVPRKDLEGSVGANLLRECEARRVVFVCRYGYL